MNTGVVNRPLELRAVSEFLRSAGTQPSGLIIEGEAGIGKTTLWLVAVDEARERGYRVLTARVGQTESQLAYATVADLLSDVDPGILADLPDLQRIAVDHVLLRATSDGPATDQHVVAAAFAGIVDRLAVGAPVLVAIDDVQWMDASSQAVIAFAARRFAGPVGVVATERADSVGATATSWLQMMRVDGIERIRISPLSLGGLHALISTRLGRSFPRPTLVRIAEISGGNPFYALELARSIQPGSRGDRASLPSSLAELMRLRTGNLDSDVVTMLLAAASVADPPLELLAQVSETSVERAEQLLEDVAGKGLITIDGNQVRFTHPLLARSVYTDASPSRRRAVHRTLARILEIPELRARHMALAASSAEPDTLQALDTAAESAVTRGAPAAAAELLELAIRLGGDSPWRRIHAARHHLQAGDPGRAHELLEESIDRFPHGVPRATALNLLASMQFHDSSFLRAAELLQDALLNAGDSPEVHVHSLMLLSFAQLNSGEFDAARYTAEQAVAEAEEIGVPALTSQVLANSVMVNCMSGLGFDQGRMARALDLEDPDGDAPIAFRASANNAFVLAYTGALDEARTQMTSVRRHCVERGAETDLIFVSFLSTLIEIWSGRFADAEIVADETVQRAEQLGGDHLRVVAMTLRATIAAYAGRERETREAAQTALEIALRCGSHRLADWSLISLGFLEVSLGNYGEALTVLQPMMARFDFVPGTEIITAGYLPDAVESLVALGRHSEAEPFIKALETNGRRLDRPWMIAMGARYRSMLLAASGDITAAEQMAHQALAEHDRLPMRFERARTLLLLGQLQRRLRQKGTATATLRQALDVFDELGAPLWADRARADLARTKVAPTHTLSLTPSEQQVAELAAAGMTNRDVAAKLFISPKTVDSNLARIYRKLGISSRAELGRIINAD